MTTRLMIIIFLLASTFSNGLASELDKKLIDNYRKDIDKKLKGQELVSQKYPNMSFYGGSLTGYYLNDKLVLITAFSNVELDSHHFTYYVIADSLVFVKERWVRIEEPDNINEYIEEHTDEDNNTKLSKLPLAIDEDNFYYIENNTIVSYQLKSFKKKINATDDVIAGKSEMINTHFKSHLDELSKIN